MTFVEMWTASVVCVSRITGPSGERWPLSDIMRVNIIASIYALNFRVRDVRLDFELF